MNFNMTSCIIIAAWVLLVLNILWLFVIGPYNIGRPQKTYTFSSYFYGIPTSLLVILLVGRIFNWW
jgi:hypothetical protein